MPSMSLKFATRILPALVFGLLSAVTGSSQAQDLSYPPPGESIRYVDKSRGEHNLPYRVDRMDVRETSSPHTIIQPGYRPYQPEPEMVGGENAAERVEILDWGSDEQNRGRPLIWKVDRPGHASNYIMGTIHVDDERIMDLSDTVLSRLRSADRLLLELELNQRTSLDVMRKMMFTDGRTLAQVIGADLYEQVRTRFGEQSGLPGSTLLLLKPWAAMVMLLRPANDSGTFLDQQLGQIARNDGIPVTGLETVDEQMAAFDTIPLEDQTELLRATMEQLDDKDALYERLRQAYLDGDLDQIVAVSQESEPDDSRLADLFEKNLITRRNERMLRRMLPYLERGNTFVAIGALHLPGKEGLLALLKDKGYRVTRLEYGM